MVKRQRNFSFTHSKIFIELLQDKLLSMPGINNSIKTDKVPVPLELHSRRKYRSWVKYKQLATLEKYKIIRAMQAKQVV